MANVKTGILDYSETGINTYVITTRLADNYKLNDADGAFAASPVDLYVDAVEDSVIKGRYQITESRTVWLDGRYTMTFYKRLGGSPAPVSDTIIGSGELWIIADTEVAVDASISSRLASSAYVAPDNAGIAALPLLSEIEASTVLAKQAKLDFVEKWILNKLVVTDSSVILYDDDNVTPLKTWTWTAATSTRSKAT